MTTSLHNTKISEVEDKVPDICKYITTQKFQLKVNSRKF